ncbi:MAG: transporter substrate-binding domain-containing protein [Carboxylicivirga sp.]|nr:transporter substrate-binding domain-containing protein [Carboxylicivirga sp.]
MIRKSIIITLIFLTSLSGFVKAGINQHVKVGVHYNPPLCSIDSSNKAKGIFIDIIDKVATSQNWSVEYVPITFAEGMDALQYGKIDLLTTVAKTKEREQIVYFSEETIFTNWGVIYSSKKNDINDITDLQGKNLAIEVGDIHAQAISQLLKDFNIEANLIWCDDLKMIFDKLSNNEADAGAVNKIYGYQQNMDQHLKATSIIFNPVNLHLAGGPLSVDLLQQFDKALIQIKASKPDFYQEVINQWLSKDVRKTPAWLHSLLYSLLFLTIILLIILLFQRSMVKKRTESLNEAQKIGDQRAKTIKQIEHEKTLILNSLDEQVVFMDHQYNLIWANNAFKNTSSQPFEELIGKKCYSVYFNRDTPCEFCQYEKSLKTNRTEAREHVSERAGKVFTHKTHPVFNTEQQPIGFVEILSDITNKKKQEAELIAAKEKAEQSDYLKSAFLANMSHEIRTPMNAIIGFSELLEDDTLTKDEKHNYLKIIQSNGNQLLKLISDILIFSQIESGHVNLQFSMVLIKNFLIDIFKQFENEISKYDKPVAIKLDLQINDQLELETDAVRLKQIIFNLLTNAIKFTEKGSITLGAIVSDSNLNMYVKDTGIGIAPDKQKVVFKRFSQIENPNLKKASGSGLGLTIAHDLIHQLGGCIQLESEVNVGSKFILSHPLNRYKLDKGADFDKPHILNNKK